ncbi:MAG: 50S ribosomal protein L25 [Verrucomicrobiales bacterium]|jgi:large subunit ribosomal protein L25|nr:50S ribosomal protein L25 [Verrucomicrobiales bacterium]|tara:strand:- start:10620 stop:11282 length:663 start_codon:yes stop_codon:yes gene_type:complete
MAKQETLQAAKREVKGTTASKRLRREGTVPAVIYGSSQREYMIQLDSKEFGDLVRRQSSQNFIVTLEIEGAQEKSKMAIVQDVQKDPLTGNLIHVDFRAVSENETIHAVVPIELTGEPAGVKGGGLLEQLLRDIEVHCRPGDLPSNISSDVNSLDIGDSLKVNELNLPDGVITKMDGEVLVALITQTRAAVSAGGLEDGEEAGEATEGEETEGSDEAASE